MEQFIHLVNQMSPYLLLGFLLSGIMHAFIPGRFYARYLSDGSIRSVIYAALFGIPLPLCSCGVIPTAMSIRREGASRASVVSFLIATPQTGVDSILATYGLLGLPFAIVRPIAALMTSLLGGTASLLLSDDSHKATRTSADDYQPTTLRQKIREALTYGFVTMMQDIGKWLVVGLAAAAFITICIPTEWFAVFKDNTMASMMLVLLMAIPMYVCATGSIPIAVALMMKGLTPGAALVLLMAGPACNVATILVVRKVLGMRTLAVYVLSIVVGAICFGTLIDYLHYHNTIDFMGQMVMTDACCHPADAWYTWACTALLILLITNALLRGNNNHQQPTPTTNMTTYHIEGMNCNHCRMAAEKAIQGVEGVTSATVDLATKEAHVEGTATTEAIKAAVEAVGFTCTE